METEEDKNPTLFVVIPALNEEDALPYTLKRLAEYCDRVRSIGHVKLRWRAPLVVDNGSQDRTVDVAIASGAEVISEPSRGYGSACLAGIQHLRPDPPDVLLFTDADGSDDLSELERMLSAISRDPDDQGAALVIGSRVKFAENGALSPLQRFGNALSCSLMRLAFNAHFTDLGPLRLIRWETLESLDMRDRDFGWTVEMQAKVAAASIPYAEVDVTYLNRYAGESKISGNLIGSYRAGVKILSTIAKVWWTR